MTEVKVLIEGYAQEKDKGELASSTTVLIKNEDLNIIVDPGMDRKKLLVSLEKENLSTKDINYVILSHYHLDHYHLDHSLLAGIFENAKILYTEEIYSFDGKIQRREQGILGPDIEIIKTPGHSSDCRTILVKTNKGIVAIVQDVIWWMDSEEQKTDKQSLIEHKDPYATDIETLKQSRKKILKLANYIIPGHGKMFKVEKQI